MNVQKFSDSQAVAEYLAGMNLERIGQISPQQMAEIVKVDPMAISNRVAAINAEQKAAKEREELASPSITAYLSTSVAKSGEHKGKSRLYLQHKGTGFGSRAIGYASLRHALVGLLHGNYVFAKYLLDNWDAILSEYADHYGDDSKGSIKFDADFAAEPEGPAVAKNPKNWVETAKVETLRSELEKVVASYPGSRPLPTLAIDGKPV